jgi:hypothetical protein
MLSEAQLFKEYLEQNEQLLLALPGGIYTWEETGRLGINFTNTPFAFNKALLLPCAFIKTKEIVPTNDLRDEAEQVMSYRRTFQIFIYQEGGTAILEEVFNMMYNMLQDKQPFPGVRTMFTNIPEGGQDESLNGANFIRIDGVEIGYLQPSS